MKLLADAGKSVNILSVEKWLIEIHPELATPGDFLRDLLLNKVPLEAAESEAGPLWDAFRLRKVAILGDEMEKALEAAPDQIDSIAHVRAASLAAEDVLTSSQRKGIKRIDYCIDACDAFWKVYEAPSNENGGEYSFIDTHKEDAMIEIIGAYQLDVPPYLKQHSTNGLNEYEPKKWFQQIMGRISEDIDCFTGNLPCPWPK